MTARRRLLLMLASLAAHGGVAALLAFASSASLPTALFIVLSELGPGAIATGPRQARANAGPPPASSRPSPSPPGPRPALRSTPDATVAPLPAPAPATPPEREAPPPRDPAPVAAASTVREESTVEARSSASASVVEAGSSGPASPRGSELSRGGAASDAGATSGTSQRSPSVGDGAGTNVAVAPSGPRGGEVGAEYGPYLSRMRGRIQEALRYPPAARRRGLKGTVLVEILIRPDGAITGVSVTSSSSHQILDDAALDAVRRLPPQPFPAGLLPRPLTVQLPVVFDLQ